MSQAPRWLPFAPLAALAFVVVVFVGCGDGPTSPSAQPTARIEYAIAIHGGAVGTLASISEEEAALYEAALWEALQVGEEFLAAGSDSLDAVEAVVQRMENDPLFNAGRGAVYTHDGRHTLDAAIMDGSNLACGAVAGVTAVKNPIHLARMVMVRSPHVLLGGDGADAFARELGLPVPEPGYFDTELRRQQWLSWKREQADADDAASPSHGTVGAVALDVQGNLAAATSTGGLTGKRYGRIGDSPVIGAGTYADDRSCAVSCTGQGEEYIRHSIAHQVAALMRHKGLSVQEAARHVIEEVLDPGDGGLIAVSNTGEIALSFNTEGMLRGFADSTGQRGVIVR